MRGGRKAAKRQKWQSRIVGHDRIDPKALQAHPLNFRRHPEKQRAAIRGSIAEVGVIRSVTVNRTTGRIIDGHARVEEAIAAGEELVDVEYIELTEEQERKALAILDRVSELAEIDPEALDELMRSVSMDDETLEKMMADLRPAPALEFSDPPETVEQNIAEIESIKGQRRAANKATESKNDTEKYLVIVYDSRQAKEQALKDLGLPADERYIPAASVTMRARGLIKPSLATSGRAIKAATPENSGAGG